MSKVYIDFEFNSTQEAKLNLVSCALSYENLNLTFWLYNDPQAQEVLKSNILALKNHLFVAFHVPAEARCFMALGLNPLEFTWIDLATEWRMLCNHNNEFAYGKQLIGGKEVTTHPPVGKYLMSEEERRSTNNSKAEGNLAACTYKLCGVRIDSEYKDDIRSRIINLKGEASEEFKEEVLKYNASDLIYLPQILEKVLAAYTKLYLESDKATVPYEIKLRGEFGARTAIMESLGYPVNVEKVKNLISNIPNILKELIEDTLTQNLPFKPFVWDKKNQRYKMENKLIREWVAAQGYPNWLKTDKGEFSIALEAFTEVFDFRHDYPRDNLGAQIVRYLKIKQSLNGFVPKGKQVKDKRVFLDFVGSDGRARGMLGLYGSQSGRSQPSSTSFIPLKSAWMRCLIEPPPGRAIAGIDWGSQEFLISAIVSRDETMFQAYISGDPYLYFAKSVGAVPPEGTKESHGKIRDLFKSTVLGISYNMGAEALAKKLTRDTGIETTKERAQQLIDQFYSTFKQFKIWNDLNLKRYSEANYIKMPCGWTMWGDNKNWRSVNNVPIQGAGASVMRKAVAYAQISQLDVIYTLHDAIYIEYDFEDYRDVIMLYRAMRQAFVDSFTGEQKGWARAIRQDVETWSSNYDLEERETVTIPCDVYSRFGGFTINAQKLYIDKRSKSDYVRFKKFLETKNTWQTIT